MVAHNFINLAGLSIGKLQVVARAPAVDARGQARWHCRCECGNETIVVGRKLRTGHTKSCGCLKRRAGTECPNTDQRPILERLAERSRIDPVTGCKLWCGATSGFGHGHIHIEGKIWNVHRAAWTAERGPIPDGIDCLHNCPGGDNPACWNVDHLWLGTQADNNADRDRKGRHVALPGERHGQARLTDPQIAAIRTDVRSYAVIAIEHGISEAHVGEIMRGSSWKHLPGATLRKRGDRHCHAKITAEVVRAIRSDPRSSRAAAGDYGISHSNVSLIRSGKAWKHVA